MLDKIVSCLEELGYEPVVEQADGPILVHWQQGRGQPYQGEYKLEFAEIVGMPERKILCRAEFTARKHTVLDGRIDLYRRSILGGIEATVGHGTGAFVFPALEKRLGFPIFLSGKEFLDFYKPQTSRDE